MDDGDDREVEIWVICEIVVCGLDKINREIGVEMRENGSDRPILH